jgi:HPt (histidine-containing phosphotransfer) domain-containing protein
MKPLNRGEINMDYIKYIDIDSALARLGGNRGLYEKLLAKFEKSVDMQEFDSAIASGDYKTAGDIAHTAKGVAGNLSLTVFFDQSVKAMDELRQGIYNKETVEQFKQAFADTNATIEEMLK